ncbi:MAG: T9SS type A sorting domain-containing protein [Melioribacteraceae bacterium]|nr:T9SS type A sorting domain-containing protein [Melioribacteraceae bacterium]
MLISKIIIKYFIISFIIPLGKMNFAQQIDIARVELMPNIPSPYEMLDWKQITIGYDSLLFDLNAVGQYLPLAFINTNTINYPAHNSFGLHSYVGTNYPQNGEAINIIPAVVGATLTGVDKSNQFGKNWVLMSEEYFNNRPSEDVYLNSPNSTSGNDFWYDTMPNIFFYQLYSQYPGTGDFDYQFRKVADRWLEAITNMSSSTTPWRNALVYYRGWYLSSMTGNSSGVLEPEAAGAISWLLYNAYSETGDEKYRIGAEWALEFLDGLSENPSYELQLAYGAYIAARMNAELKTGYDIHKILSWCFNVGTLRNWGAILGKWGNYEVNGLIGEVNGVNDYAFLMNTFEQIGTLAPLVRYDDRYARTIGKWILNAANASRLFYSKYLPDNNQDSKAWSQVYDPNSYIAYEAIRENKYNLSPYATGDAITGGWAATNLALYGSSHVGILGGIIETTNVEKILKIDLLKTDYFHQPAYPTYLIYNPFSEAKEIQFELPNGTYDLYDAASNVFISSNASGLINIQIPDDSALLLVLTPSGGEIEFDLHKMLIDGVVVDYNSGQTVDNYPPRIKALASDNNTPLVNSNTTLYCTATDFDEDNLNYSWTINGESVEQNTPTIIWNTPDVSGVYNIKCFVDDGTTTSNIVELNIEVVNTINNPPIIERIKAAPRKMDLSAISKIECFAFDEDGDNLTYNWTSQLGTISGSGEKIEWTAPSIEGNYFIKCEVSDNQNNSASDSIKVMVRDLSNIQTGELIAFFPFNGDVSDVSGNLLNGINYGAKFISDRFGNSGSALKFDGENDYISVKNDPLLNFQNSISVSFWLQANELYDREMYPLSHGNWENRWKISIGNNRVRWTLNTNTGIKDLDSETIIKEQQLYFIAASYNGVDMELYLNGELDAFTNFSGNINTTDIDFTIAKVLPDNSQYNFKGTLDDIRIFDYAITLEEIEILYDIKTSIEEEKNYIPKETKLMQNYPNPFNGQTNIKFHINSTTKTELIIYDILGRKIKTLFSGVQKPGRYSLSWDSNSNDGNELSSGIYFLQLKTDDFSETKKLLLLQ